MDDKNHSDQSKRFPPLDKGNLTRRTFLKGLAAIGISAKFSGIFSGSTGKASAISGEASESYVTEPSRNIPIYRNVDVLVVGGGMAGISAAIAAGRMGMNTMLIEYMGFLGGNATNALVTDFCGFYTRTAQTVQLIKGIGGEIAEELIDNGGGRKWRHIVDFQPEALKIVLDKKLLGANVELLY
ncbi:MAG: dependent oxidoreductase [Firmicutes bacterium]|nr:dependent oxidoreductase [Bacillota bacterium]